MTTAVERRYVVRVALEEEQAEDEKIKGMVAFVVAAGYAVVHENNVSDAALMFDLRPPAEVADEDTRQWAEKLAAQMEEQGYDAWFWSEKSDG